ncbi:MAG: Trk family potassium uptake protein [Lachnospira sp.]|nr:Trk family potassium uptake protein [Lachnospira sp.]
MKKNSRPQHMSHSRIMLLGFLIVIAVGTVLLTLPISSRSGEWTNPLSALFTATSATCVTGLVVVDTYRYWNIFGQVIILIMIQIGGLGFITLGVLLSMFLRQKIGLERRNLIQESVSAMQLSGVVKLVKNIVKGTFVMEGIGAVILSIRFIPSMGILEGLYNGLFHSVSAFCNAGFDLMGRYEEYSSLTRYYSDPVVNITVMLLIILGGLGFIVWEEIKINRFHFKKYSLHAKMVLLMTTILIFGGAVLYWLFERDNLMQGMNVYEQGITSLFASVTARTAGYNTIDLAGMTQPSKLLTIILMFIGGSPGSTAGGVKTTTLLVMIVYIWSNLRNSSGCNIFGRRVGDEDIKKSSMVFGLNLFLAILAMVVISATGEFVIEDLMLEVFSAIGTVGLSTGITRQLNELSQLVIILLMYCGRIGSMTFALSFTYKRESAPVRYPEERINVG